MFLMIMGFAFAQMVVNYGHDEESFENPIKSFMMTLTMALGEYNFIDIYNSYRNDRISRGFAMILLVLLILFGTIAMVNLFIAVIISDISQLREDVYTQNLGILYRIFISDKVFSAYMAQHSILVERLFSKTMLGNMRVAEKINVCIHRICSKGCPGISLPPNLRRIKENLRQILKENTVTSSNVIQFYQKR